MPQLTASPRSSSEHLRFSNQWRTSPPTIMAEVVRRVHENVTAADSPEEAVEMARLLAGKEDVIIAFGSLSFLGDIIRIAEKRQQ